MLDDSVTLRPMRAQDCDAIGWIIDETWYAEPGAERLTADQKAQQPVPGMAQFEVGHYGMSSTHAVVAEMLASDGCEPQVAGMIMWRTDSLFNDGAGHVSAVDETEKYVQSKRAQDAKYEEMCAEFEYFDKLASDKLAKDAAAQCQAEIRLFVISADARGKGVGKGLLKYAVDEMRKQGVSNYYLYTDTDCDYQFYDAQGFTRVAQALQAPGPMGSIIDKFIYMKHID